MRARRPLAATIELVQDISEISPPLEGFLRRHRHRAKTRLDDGSRTDVYVADFIDRAPGTRDAVAVGVFCRKDQTRPAGETLVLLRRQVRYAAFLVTGEPLFTEVVAGLLEEPETPEAATIRELLEEAAIAIEPAKVHRLGKPFFVLPGTLTERIIPMAAEATEEELRHATEAELTGDGHPLEEGAEIIVLTLADALAQLESTPAGDTQAMADAKTEIVFRRLHDAITRGAL